MNAIERSTFTIESEKKKRHKSSSVNVKKISRGGFFDSRRILLHCGIEN